MKKNKKTDQYAANGCKFAYLPYMSLALPVDDLESWFLPGAIAAASSISL